QTMSTLIRGHRSAASLPIMRRVISARLFALAVVLILTLAACHRATSKQEKALRAEVGEALRERSYSKAAEVARRLIQLNPHDNGSWDRLVQAQFGLQDRGAIKQTLEQWRQTVK